MSNIENKCFVGDSIDSTMDTTAASMMHELLGTKPQRSNIEKLIERMGKEGEIVRVLVDALRWYSVNMPANKTLTADLALARAEELAGEV